ncbi:MAG: SsrA-binding protein SmpB [Paracoccaceae bacterium]
MAQKKKKPVNKPAAENRRARYDYFIEDTLEAGILLEGSEVKSLREGSANITESYAAVENGELWLVNSYIPPFSHAKSDAFSHKERRRRKLLVHKKELSRLWQATGRQGMTLVPMKLYFNDKGRAKLEIGVAKGKKAPDKRATEAKRDWQRDKARLLRDRG